MTDLPEPDPVASDRRKLRKQSKLPPDAACALCGATDPDLLTVKEPLLEAHHVFGRAASPDVTVVLCRNCHALQTGQQHDHDALPPLGRDARPDSLLERLARALISLALFVHGLAHQLTAFAAQLLAFVAELDRTVEGWRDWPVAT